ncbi:MAG: TrkA family potassium uptake protein, partial [Actinomycetota bacterium]|nr:TrkA family potassium uptake protein [Actinomycetota bacterium]
GAQLAEMLSLDNQEVVVIDRDSSAFDRLFKLFPGEVVQGVSFDSSTLKKAGVEKADALAAVTSYDNANLMTAEVAKNVYGVPRVVARIYNPDKEETYRALGIDYVIGTEIVARSIMEIIARPMIRRRARCCQGSLNLLEFDCPPRWAGQTMEWCERQVPIWIAYLVREGNVVFPDRHTILEEGDEITALASDRVLGKLEVYLRRKAGSRG